MKYSPEEIQETKKNEFRFSKQAQRYSTLHNRLPEMLYLITVI